MAWLAMAVAANASDVAVATSRTGNPREIGLDMVLPFSTGMGTGSWGCRAGSSRHIVQTRLRGHKGHRYAINPFTIARSPRRPGRARDAMPLYSKENPRIRLPGCATQTVPDRWKVPGRSGTTPGRATEGDRCRPGRTRSG